MIGCIKAISPCVKSASAKLFLDLYTVLAPSGEEKKKSVSKKVARAPTMPKLCSIPRTPTLKVLAAQQDLAIFVFLC